MDYTIVKKNGQEVRFSTDLSPDQAATVLREKKARGFALEMVLAHESGKASRNQTLWLLNKAQEALSATPAASRPVGPFAGLVTRLAEWQAGVKGQVQLRLPGARVKVCNVESNPNFGALYVYSEGGDYVGKVDQGGNACVPPAFAAILSSAASDPVGAAKAYGHETGKCACCGTKLEDPVSVWGGIGPVCLERLAGKGARRSLEMEYKIRKG